MKRRDFVTTIAAAGLLPHVALRATAQAQPKPAGQPPITLGVATYSLRNFSLDQALEMSKALDVKHLTFKDMHIPRNADAAAVTAARSKVEAAGFTIMGGGTITFRNDEAQIRKEFEYAKLAGMPVIVGAPDFASLDAVEKMAKEFQIKVAIHNHGPEDKFFPSPYDAYKAIKGRDPMMGLCIDIGHTVRADTDPVKAVLELKDRVYDLHLKDLRDLKNKDSQVIVGKGAIDIVGLFKALVKVGFKGHAALEYEIDAKDPLAGMQQSFAYMRGVLAGMTTT